MRRGTTPTHIFNVDVDLRDAEAIYITYAQPMQYAAGSSDCLCLHEIGESSGIGIIAEKAIEDITIGEDTLTVKLTQEETMKFSDGKDILIQIAARFADGSAIRSNIIYTDVQGILKDEVV